MNEPSFNGVALHWQVRGEQGPAIVFAHGLLMNSQMFAAQMEALSESYRCLAFDFRGQGKSPVTSTGYDMDTLTDDAAAFIEAAVGGPCHFVGLSMGGFIGMRLAARRPELIRSLTLLNTSAQAEPAENVPRYRRLNFVARWFGLRWVVDQVMPIMFGRSFLANSARSDEKDHWRNVLASNRRDIWRAAQGVIDRDGVENLLSQIECPTLVLVGEEDVATIPDKGRAIADGIAGGTLLTIPEAGHSSTIENADFVSQALKRFLARVEHEAADA